MGKIRRAIEGWKLIRKGAKAGKIAKSAAEVVKEWPGKLKEKTEEIIENEKRRAEESKNAALDSVEEISDLAAAACDRLFWETSEGREAIKGYRFVDGIVMVGLQAGDPEEVTASVKIMFADQQQHLYKMEPIKYSFPSSDLLPKEIYRLRRDGGIEYTYKIPQTNMADSENDNC